MVKSRKGFLLSVMMLIAAICMLFAACGGGDKAKLNFNTNGGPEIESVEVTLGEAYELPEPTWEGYSFEGWYLESDFSGSPVTSVTPEKDMTFYAKWEQMYAIKLELGGGTLEAGTTLYAKEGTNISDFMQQYVPTFSDHQFGEWLTGGVPLSAGATLTKEGVTLTAHYKIAYSVELYLQKLDLSGYEKAAENYIGYEYVTGTAFTAAPALEGFTAIDHDGSVMTKTLTENASENTFVRYFDRNQIALVLNANYPDLQGEGNTESETVSFLYGSEVTLPVPFSYRGYGLIGWSTTADGKAEYNSDFISSRLFNGAAETEVFKVQKPMTLYAVWLQGYSNMFGGSDYIFHFAEDAEEIYLLRGDKMFLGTFDPETSEFDFFSTDASGEEVNMLQGKLYTDGTFSYYSDARDGFTFTYMKNLVGADENYKIHLDGYNGLEYTDATNPHNTSKGTYTINADGFYDVEYTEGPMAGQSFVYALSRSSSGAYFLVRDEEEYGWGAIPRGVIYQGHLTYYTSVYAITLNGFGNATFANPDGSTTSYYYRRDDNEITLMNAYGMPVGIARLTTISGARAYLLYSTTYDHVYESESGETLALDGMYTATYADASGLNTLSGMYTLYASELGNLVQFYATDNTVRLFLITTATETQIGDDGTSEQVTTYKFTAVTSEYTEVQYSKDGSVYYSPLFVLNDTEVGKASVYAYVSNAYVKVLTGRVAKDEQTDVYTFTTEDVLTEESFTSEPFHIASLLTCTFSIDTVMGSDNAYTIMYWHSMTMKEEEKQEFDKTYTASDGSTLTVTQGFGVYKTTGEGAATYTGPVSTSQDGITSLYYYDFAESEAHYYYFELNDETNSFIVLSLPIGSFNELLDNGYITSNQTLTFNGKGGATYAVTTRDDAGTASTVTTEGRFTETDEESAFGSPVYIFTATDSSMSFKFIFVSVNGSDVYFAKYNETLNGEFTNGDEKLLLDGYAFLATYTVSADESYSGFYELASENVVVLTTATRLFYIDLKENKTFTVRDDVYGNYLYVKNQSIDALTFGFDGYGKLTVTDISGEDPVVICKDGTYELQANGSYLLSYTNNGERAEIVGHVGTITMSSSTYNAFYYDYGEVYMSYVDEKDWSVLVLSDCGTATRYSAEGGSETGDYAIVTETMLYYVNDDGSDACIYIYDKAKGTIKAINNVERAYYTEDFQAMLFTRYGFMIMNGQTRYYYNLDQAGNVLLYRQDPTNEKANKYGFVEETFFGTFEDTKTFDGKTYYQSSSFQLTFTRNTATQNKFPITVTSGQGDSVTEQKIPLGQLQFSPSGSAEFTDTGASVYIGEDRYTCTVSRVKVGDGDDATYQMQIVIPNGLASFVFEIDLKYLGDEDDVENTYEITSMRTQATLYDTIYLNFLINYMMQGYVVPNTFGVIQLMTPFDEDGEAGKAVANGTFGPDSGIVDTTGELLDFENAEYTYENRIYTVYVDGKDGYRYSLNFAVDSTYVQYLGMYAYGLYAFSRVQELTTADGYTVTAERVLMTENRNISIGGFWSLTLKLNGEEITSETGYVLDGAVYYLVRTRDKDNGNKITASTVYVITFKEKTPEIVEGEEDSNTIMPYESATVTKAELSVAYDADGKAFIEYSADHKIVLLYNGTGTYLFTEDEIVYDEAAKTFTLTLSSGRTFTVTIDDNNVITVTVTDAPSDQE